MQHTRHVQIVRLKRNRERHDIEIAHGRLRLKREQRRAPLLILAHLALVRQKDALAGDLWNLVENLIQRLKTQVRHPHAVNIRVTQSDAQARPPLQNPPLLGGEFLFVTFYYFHNTVDISR
jgi:hypothetical protein